MRIVLLCGSLEPGRDGVGDYTRSLGAELIRKGHQVAAISLNDRSISVKTTGIQRSGEVDLQVLRLPSLYSSKKRFLLARDWVGAFNPEWISLQYVPYSFQEKGLPFRLEEHLYMLGVGKKWHIMFHEIWVGFTRISPVKHRIIGFLQRNILKSVVEKLQPHLITTSNGLYQAILSTHQISAVVLPLFSNISISPFDSTFITEVLKRLSISKDKRCEWMFVGIFGNLHTDANLKDIVWDICRRSKKEGKRLAVIGFGQTDSPGLNIFYSLESTFCGNARFVHLGLLSPEHISSLLQFLDAGISCTPLQHIGKSGVYAAMRYHGLKVLLNKGQIIPEYRRQIDKYFKELEMKSPGEWDVSTVGTSFLKLLTD